MSPRKPSPEPTNGPARDWLQKARAFGEQVQQARTQRQLTPWQLAEQCRMSAATVKYIERGRPVEQRAIESVCRALGLPVPKLESDPVYTFAVLVRRRREQARLKHYQLAALSGLSVKALKEVEHATRWPKPETCVALLSVTALHIRTQDIAPFVADVYAASDLAERIRQITQERISASPKLIARTKGTASDEEDLDENDLEEFGLSESDFGEATPPAGALEPSPAHPKNRLLFTLRVYTDGSLIFTPSVKDPRNEPR